MRNATTRLAFALFALAALAVTGCRTTRGFGEDLESLGGNISDEATEEQYD